MTEPDGVVPVDKPQGPTSHDAVARARKLLGTRRIGHTGTLDPFASGLLLLCVGRATRLAEYLTALPKSYHATIRLGEATDTDDLTGEVVLRSDRWQSVTEAEVRAALAGQVGRIRQLPPVYSAKKVGGERAYAAARRGETVERTTVEVEVHGIELLRFAPPDVDVSVDCSSGTYIRAIARDVGEALGTGGHLTRLRRTRVGRFAVEDALQLDALGDPDTVGGAMLSPAEAVAHLARQEVGEEAERALANGRPVPAAPALPEGEPLAVLGAGGRLLAIGERDGEWIRPRKVFG